MKKLFVTILCSVAALTGWTQGTVNFANVGAGVNAPVREDNGTTLLAGVAYQAVLYFALGADQPLGNLQPLLSTQTAFSAVAAQAGYFLGGAKGVTGTASGDTITVQIRAWRASDGASYDVAANTVGAHVGKGNLINVKLGGGATPTPNMVGITPFNLMVVIPEPSTIALGLLGAGLLLFRRRK